MRCRRELGFGSCRSPNSVRFHLLISRRHTTRSGRIEDDLGFVRAVALASLGNESARRAAHKAPSIADATRRGAPGSHASILRASIAPCGCAPDPRRFAAPCSPHRASCNARFASLVPDTLFAVLSSRHTAAPSKNRRADCRSEASPAVSHGVLEAFS